MNEKWAEDHNDSKKTSILFFPIEIEVINRLDYYTCNSWIQ